MIYKQPIIFTLDANDYNGVNYTSGIDKNDILIFSQGVCALVILKKKDGVNYDVITAYPFKWSKYAIIRFLRFIWIYVKYNFSKIKKYYISYERLFKNRSKCVGICKSNGTLR